MPKAKPNELKPPKHLRSATADWFSAVMQTYSLEPHHIKLLTKACEAHDRCESAREAIQEHGLTYIDGNGNPKSRPEISIERDSRIAMARLIRELDLDAGTPSEPKRPPSLHSNRG